MKPRFETLSSILVGIAGSMHINCRRRRLDTRVFVASGSAVQVLLCQRRCPLITLKNADVMRLPGFYAVSLYRNLDKDYYYLISIRRGDCQILNSSWLSFHFYQPISEEGYIKERRPIATYTRFNSDYGDEKVCAKVVLYSAKIRPCVRFLFFARIKALFLQSQIAMNTNT